MTDQREALWLLAAVAEVGRGALDQWAAAEEVLAVLDWGVSPQAVGAKLAGLERRGLVESQPQAQWGMKLWRLAPRVRDLLTVPPEPTDGQLALGAASASDWGGG